MCKSLKGLFFLLFLSVTSSCVSLVGPETNVKTIVRKKTPKNQYKKLDENAINSSKNFSAKECKKVYRVLGNSYCVLKHSRGFEQVGMASWYGPNFHGKKTATGEIYNMYEMTAAHKTLPLGTYVKVINLENGRNLIVRVNDRGPFVAGRIIDLSYEAARRLGVVAKGTAKVKVIALGKKVDSHYESENYERGLFYIQLAAFKDDKSAEEFAKKLKGKFKVKVVKAFGLYRVVVGPQLTYVKAAELKDKIKPRYPNAFVMTFN